MNPHTDGVACGGRSGSATELVARGEAANAFCNVPADITPPAVRGWDSASQQRRVGIATRGILHGRAGLDRGDAHHGNGSEDILPAMSAC
jgi:hypothetical protein